MFLGSKVWRVRIADSLSAICEPNCLDNLGFLTSHSLIGFQGLLRGFLRDSFYCSFTNFYK
jgi:hypothetical protein